MDKEDVEYIYNGILLVHIIEMKTCHLQHEGTMLSEIKSEQDKYHDSTYIWNLINKEKQNELES